MNFRDILRIANIINPNSIRSATEHVCSILDAERAIDIFHGRKNGAWPLNTEGVRHWLGIEATNFDVQVNHDGYELLRKKHNLVPLNDALILAGQSADAFDWCYFDTTGDLSKHSVAAWVDSFCHANLVGAADYGRMHGRARIFAKSRFEDAGPLDPRFIGSMFKYLAAGQSSITTSKREPRVIKYAVPQNAVWRHEVGNAVRNDTPYNDQDFINTLAAWGLPPSVAGAKQWLAQYSHQQPPAKPLYPFSAGVQLLVDNTKSIGFDAAWFAFNGHAKTVLAWRLRKALQTGPVTAANWGDRLQSVNGSGFENLDPSDAILLAELYFKRMHGIELPARFRLSTAVLKLDAMPKLEDLATLVVTFPHKVAGVPQSALTHPKSLHDYCDAKFATEPRTPQISATIVEPNVQSTLLIGLNNADNLQIASAVLSTVKPDATLTGAAAEVKQKAEELLDACEAQVGTWEWPTGNPADAWSNLTPNQRLDVMCRIIELQKKGKICLTPMPAGPYYSQDGSTWHKLWNGKPSHIAITSQATTFALTLGRWLFSRLFGKPIAIYGESTAYAKANRQILRTAEGVLSLIADFDNQYLLFSKPIDVLGTLRSAHGAQAPRNGEQWSIHPCSPNGETELRVVKVLGLDTKLSRLLPVYATERDAQRALDQVGEAYILAFLQSYHAW